MHVREGTAWAAGLAGVVAGVIGFWPGVVGSDDSRVAIGNVRYAWVLADDASAIDVAVGRELGRTPNHLFVEADPVIVLDHVDETLKLAGWYKDPDTDLITDGTWYTLTDPTPDALISILEPRVESGLGWQETHPFGEILAIRAATPMSACVADLDNDGAVNVADLFMLLHSWGNCP